MLIIGSPFLPPHMNNRLRQPMISMVLEPMRPILGEHFVRYRNHSCRLFDLSNLLYSGDLTSDQKIDLSIACVFNSLHIWTCENGTDYETRVVPLIEFLANQNMLDRINTICHMIGVTGKYDQSPLEPRPLEEAFRKAYWIDITKGTRTFSLSSSIYKRVLKKHPSRGFHWLLRTRTQDLTKTDSRIQGALAR